MLKLIVLLWSDSGSLCKVKRLISGARSVVSGRKVYMSYGRDHCGLLHGMSDDIFSADEGKLNGLGVVVMRDRGSNSGRWLPVVLCELFPFLYSGPC